MSDTVTLETLDARVTALEAMMAKRPAAAPVPAGEVATDAELDGAYGDPVVKYPSKKWTGPSFEGKRYSQCSPEFLEDHAKYQDWRARKATEEGNPDRAGYAAKDGRLARGWAARLRASPAPAHVDPTTALPAGDDNEIPF